jgi:hypothetical protein
MFTGTRQQQRYVRRYRAEKGSVRRFVLVMLRDAKGQGVVVGAGIIDGYKRRRLTER